MSIIEKKTYPIDLIRIAEARTFAKAQKETAEWFINLDFEAGECTVDEVARLYLSAVKRGQVAESELVEAGYHPIESNGRPIGYKRYKSC